MIFLLVKEKLVLRNKYKYDGIGKWYGVTWKEEDNAHNVTDIYSDGDSALCDSLPIQSKMRRCIIKDGIFQYYLNNNNSNYKEDGVTVAKLDGTDGNVMVEIPEFFYKFETSVDEFGVKTVKLKISENGIDGFSYSPKHYVGAYHSTLNRNSGYLATVCTALFNITEEELFITDVDTYVEGGTYSLGVQKLAIRSGFTANAATSRGGNQSKTALVRDPISGNNVSSDYWDNADNPLEPTFCLNKLGVAVAQVKRSDCRNQSKMWIGETMYLYDTQKALWMLSTVEFKTRNIQDPINKITPRNGGLGWGATVYPNYNAYEAFFFLQRNSLYSKWSHKCFRK